MIEIAFPKLYYILSSSSSSTDLRSDGPSDPSTQLWRSEAHISLGEQFGYANIFVTLIRPHPQALALNFASLEHLRSFLLMYFNPDCLFLFQATVEGIVSSLSLI
jgi:hypothetical protein